MCAAATHQEKPSVCERSHTEMYIWTIISRADALVDVSDKPVWTLVDLAASSEARPISISAYRSKPVTPAAIIHHHSAGPGTAHFLSHVLSSQTLAVCSSRAPTLFVHLAHHTRGWCCDTAAQCAKTPHYPSVGRPAAHTDQCNLRDIISL